MTIKLPKWLADLIERAASSAIENALVLIVGASAVDLHAVGVAAAVGITVGLSVVINALRQRWARGKLPMHPVDDLFLRTLSTFVQTLAALATVSPDRLSWGTVAAAMGTSTLALVKGNLAMAVGKATPSLLPAHLDPGLPA